ETAVGEPARPVAEHPGREAALCDDDARVRGRIGELRVADRRERQVAERAAAVPSLVTRLRDDAFRGRRRIDVRQRRQPVDAAEAVAALPATLGVEEVVGKRLRIALREAESGETRGGLHRPRILTWSTTGRCAWFRRHGSKTAFLRLRAGSS